MSDVNPGQKRSAKGLTTQQIRSILAADKYIVDAKFAAELKQADNKGLLIWTSTRIKFMDTGREIHPGEVPLAPGEAARFRVELAEREKVVSRSEAALKAEWDSLEKETLALDARELEFESKRKAELDALESTSRTLDERTEKLAAREKAAAQLEDSLVKREKKAAAAEEKTAAKTEK